MHSLWNGLYSVSVSYCKEHRERGHITIHIPRYFRQDVEVGWGYILSTSE